MKPILRQHKKDNIYFREDPHLTAKGNRIVGERVAEFLVESELGR